MNQLPNTQALWKIEKLIQDQLGLTVTPTTDLKSVGADSLDLVEIIMAVEDEFRIEIPDATFASISQWTPERILQLVLENPPRCGGSE